LKRPTVAPRYMCTSPIQVKWRALEAYIGVRCRSCPGCMRVRQYGWSARAAREQALAKRTWFVTLTFKPSERAAIMAAASADLSAKPPEQRLITAAGVSVTAYMKTLRKRGFKLRYVWVPELHRDGFPHFHGLLHTDDSTRWRDIAGPWRAGFLVAKLVTDANALRYVTKYLSKAKLGRVRASLNYGDHPDSPISKRAKLKEIVARIGAVGPRAISAQVVDPDEPKHSGPARAEAPEGKNKS